MAGQRFGPGAALLSCVCALMAAWLAAHHPLSAVVAMAVVLAAMVIAALRPYAVPVLMLALMPLAGLAPWTGWRVAEEFDLLALALLAGGWARLAWTGGLGQPVAAPWSRTGWLWWLLAVAYAAAFGVSVLRGLADADAIRDGALASGWWQGWREPMNVLRLAKPLAWAWLAWPFWLALQARDPRRAANAVGHGGLGALAVVSVLCLWERWVWPGLGNFSTDYRTTALFWETHVGGAALDGCLALAWPFGLWALNGARQRRDTAWTLAVLSLAAYAVLTTFSRGLYLGVAVGTLLVWLLTPRAEGPAVGRGVSAAWLLLFGAGAALAFPGSGWRGLAALWGLIALLFLGWQRGAVSGRVPKDGLAVLMGASVGALLAAGALALPGVLKAPYLLFAGAAAATGWAWWAPRSPGRRRTGLVAWCTTAAATVAVALHWGESATRWAMLGAVALLAAAAAVGGAVPAWRGPPGGRWRANLLGAMGLAGLVVGSLTGGQYIESRLSSADQDWAGRLRHWQLALSLPSAPADEVWGIGVGRFAARFAFRGPVEELTGDEVWTPSADGGALVLTSGRHVLGHGELYRMSQRVPAPSGPVTVRWRAQVDAPAGLHVELCHKHLLYDAGCTIGHAALGGPAKRVDDGGWEEGGLTLAALEPGPSPVFSLALDTPGARMRLDRIEAFDARGRPLLRNGGFESGLAGWLPSSDRYHMPWHAKSLAVHLQVEQGWIGVVLFFGLVLVAVVHVAGGAARRHPLAPALLAALAGFLVVGLFDSLLDVPRVAFVWFWLLGVAATLWAPGVSAGAAVRPTPAASTAARPSPGRARRA